MKRRAPTVLGDASSVATDCAKLWFSISPLIFLVLSLPGFAGRIHDAAQAGDREGVEELFQGGVDVDERGDQQGTALQWASYTGHLSVVELLLRNGADVELTADYGRTAMHVAALKGHASIVRALIEGGAQVDPVDHEGVTPLGLAVSSCQVEVAGLLIEPGAEVNRRFHAGASVLHGLPYADRPDDHRAMAELLLAAGADIEAATTRERNTPLQLAAMFGDYDTAELLIAAGAEIESSNAFGDRPLHSAAIAGQARIVNLLLAHGARVDVADVSGMTPLHWTAARGERRKGQSMHEFITAMRGGTPLPHDYVATARELIDHGAPLDARDRKGRTPWKLAKKRGDRRMIALLEAAIQP